MISLIFPLLLFSQGLCIQYSYQYEIDTVAGYRHLVLKTSMFRLPLLHPIDFSMLCFIVIQINSFHLNLVREVLCVAFIGK